MSESYFRLDTDALDAMDPVEAYHAATKVPDAAKAEASAYADAIAYRFADLYGHREGARLLGIAQPTLSERVKKHLRRLRHTHHKEKE